MSQNDAMARRESLSGSYSDRSMTDEDEQCTNIAVKRHLPKLISKI